MSLLTCTIDDFLSYTNVGSWASPKYEHKLKQPFQPEHTYVFIFGPSNHLQYSFLKSLPGIKIVYESPRAVNRTLGHGDAPRNTLVIVETIKEPDEIPAVRAVPKVPKKRAGQSGGQPGSVPG
jgi:hypothetical protein